ncbi:DUF485 domain-containing protein [Streptomyces blattellae]|uniref:DUF485 domain-containing protein n=1 Tax=Streptomyces blattellae TaxID=2569855 RepID=UPI0012BA0973|nr:DUF485 domain-containing protein [Streptomyces blattellae]
MHYSNGRPGGGGGGPESTADQYDGCAPSAAETPGSLRYDDPWYDALASGWGESCDAEGPVAAVPPVREERERRAAADVYLEVQRSAAFREVRSRYRRFVVPAVAGFFAWYIGYVVTATTAPGLMGRPVAGAVNVAMIAGLGQFLSTFLLTWAYARHARLRRDRAALELRWETQELTREARGGAS